MGIPDIVPLVAGLLEGCMLIANHGTVMPRSVILWRLHLVQLIRIGYCLAFCVDFGGVSGSDGAEGNANALWHAWRRRRPLHVGGVQSADGGGELRRVWRDVLGIIPFSGWAEGRVVPASQRSLAHGRVGHVTVGIGMRRWPALVEVLRLELAKVCPPPPLAVPDDAEADNHEKQHQAANHDANLGAEVQWAVVEPGGIDFCNGCRFGDIDFVIGK